MQTSALLAICDPDIRYSTRLFAYLEKRTDFPYAVRLFSSYLLCRDALQTKPADLLLIDADCAKEAAGNFPAREVVLLGDPAAGSALPFPMIDKFQHVAAVTRELCLLSHPRVPDTDTAGKLHALCVYSPVSACLKTTFALALGLCLGERANSLYLNLEDVSGLDDFFGQTQNDLSDLLYYLQSDPALALSAFREALHNYGALSVFPPPACAFDLYTTTESSWRNLLRFLSAEAGVRFLIVDLGNALGKLPFFLSVCEKIYLPFRKERRANKKLSAFMESLPQIGGGAAPEKTVPLEMPRETIPFPAPENPGALVNSAVGRLARQQLMADGFLPAP